MTGLSAARRRSDMLPLEAKRVSMQGASDRLGSKRTRVRLIYMNLNTTVSGVTYPAAIGDRQVGDDGDDADGGQRGL